MLSRWFGRNSGSDAVIPADNKEPALADALPLSADARHPIRAGWILVAVGFGGFMLWATTARLDEGVPALGQVIVQSKRKTVQHLSGGMIRELLVREAQRVKLGDILIHLDDTQAKANFEATRQAFYSLKAMEARLIAEQTGQREIVFAEALTGQQPVHPMARQHMTAQRQVLAARRSALEGEVAILEQSAKEAEEQAKGFEAQLRFMKDELAGMRELAAEGYAPRNRQFEMERQFAELQANAVRTRHMVTENKLRAMQRRQDYRREVETQLADTRREAATAEQKMLVAKEDLDRTIIRAPSEGSVTGLQIHTVGGVVTPGQKLMDIVPSDEELILEVHVASHLIDRVHVGLATDINFQTFANDSQLVIVGKVTSISADLVADQPNQPPYYLAQVAVTPEGMRMLGKRQLQPGMPADVVIKTGERTVLTYLLKPLFRRLASALTEV
ncbi:MAG: HlyD family type I secretion periplasmic adaptor subunit [Sulfurisoma sp.]|nr:HlyD family type I secretion periplasmic adaptor subunit [Sulfurisoma sp.]